MPWYYIVFIIALLLFSCWGMVSRYKFYQKTIDKNKENKDKKITVTKL